MRILVAECKQEVSSFNPVLSRYEDFEMVWGAALIAAHSGLNTEMAGALDVFHEHDVTIVPAYSARAITSGGTLAAADYARIRNEFLGAIRNAPPIDGVYFSLHGAMAAENEPDPEGALLAETRAILGEQVPIVVSLDLHGILTDRILAQADAVVAFHTYPHVDFYATGERAARLLLRILRDGVRPVTACVPIPALVRGDELITETGLFGRMIRQAQAIESSPGGLSAGMFIGNPFTDVPDLRSNSFVVTDGDEERARREAVRMAQAFWDVHTQLQQPLISLEEAVQIAAATHQGTVILTDAADATSSGAPGDSNAILRALIESDYTGSALVPLVDPEAVQQAEEAGIGATIQTTLGGKLDRERFTPLAVEARVRLLSDGYFISESNGALWRAGKSAVLQVGRHIVIVTSRPVSLYDRSLFWAHGQDPQRFDAVVVKSPHCQPHMFAAWAETVLNVDAPGATSANLKSLGHTQCRRPIFPLDEDVSFTPEAKVFKR